MGPGRITSEINARIVTLIVFFGINFFLLFVGWQLFGTDDGRYDLMGPLKKFGKNKNLWSKKNHRPFKYDPELRLVPGSNASHPDFQADDTRVFLHEAYYNPYDPDHISLTVLSDAAHFAYHKRWVYSHYCAYYDRSGRFVDRQIMNVYTRTNFLCVFNINRTNGVVPHSVFVYRRSDYIAAVDKTTTSIGLSSIGTAGSSIIATTTGSAPTTETVTKIDVSQLLLHDDRLKLSPPWRKRIWNNAAAMDDHEQQSTSATNATTIAVCVKVLYDQPNWLMFLQFLEYYRSKGVSRFFVKVKSSQLNEEVNKILAYYHYDMGLMDIMEWDLPNLPFCNRHSEFCAMEQVQDCVFRTAFRYTYTIVVDFDELIRGRFLNESLIDIIHRFDRKYDDYRPPKEANPTIEPSSSSQKAAEGHHCGSFMFHAEYHIHMPNLRPSVRRLSWNETIEALLSTKNDNNNKEKEFNTKDDISKFFENTTEISSTLSNSTSANTVEEDWWREDWRSQDPHSRLLHLLHAHLPWLNFNYVATNFTPGGYSPKTACRPERIRRQWIHYTHTYLDESTWKTCQALHGHDREEGFFYHFKNITLWGEGWRNDTLDFTEYRDVRHLTVDEELFGLQLLKNIADVIVRIAAA